MVVANASLRSNVAFTCQFKSTTTRPQRQLPQVARCDATTPSFSQRAAMATAACALAATLVGNPLPAVAADSPAVEPVYFGNGCFWGRQYDFVKTEQSLGRSPEEISSIVGYAGGRIASPSNKVCYYYTPEKETVYERLGHAEVVQVELRGEDDATKKAQFKKMADTYFSQFRKLPGGKMLRQDPQDAGPGYRNVVGIPGGTGSPLYKLLQEANVNNMELREGAGGAWQDGQPVEDDLLNVVWVVDSDKLPFYQAERYHQFHNGLGKKFPEKYTKDLKEAVLSAGKLPETGCPEFFFLGS